MTRVGSRFRRLFAAFDTDEDGRFFEPCVAGQIDELALKDTSALPAFALPRDDGTAGFVACPGLRLGVLLRAAFQLDIGWGMPAWSERGSISRNQQGGGKER